MHELEDGFRPGHSKRLALNLNLLNRQSIHADIVHISKLNTLTIIKFASFVSPQPLTILLQRINAEAIEVHGAVRLDENALHRADDAERAQNLLVVLTSDNMQTPYFGGPPDIDQGKHAAEGDEDNEKDEGVEGDAETVLADRLECTRHDDLQKVASPLRGKEECQGEVPQGLNTASQHGEDEVSTLCAKVK